MLSFRVLFPVVEFSVIYFGLYFLCYIILIYIKITSLSVTDYSATCLADLWSEYKEEIVSLSWETRTDLLPFYFPVFISKLSECMKVGLFAAFLAAYANFSVFMNDTA